MEEGVKLDFDSTDEMETKAYEVAKGLLKTKWGFTHVHKTPEKETDWKPSKNKIFPYLTAIKNGKRLLKFIVLTSSTQLLAKKSTSKGIDATIWIYWKNTEEYNSTLIFH